MVKATLNDLNAFLKEQDLDAHIQEETEQVYVVFKIDDRDFPFFIRTKSPDDPLQLLVFMPTNTKSGTVADTARLLHLLNKEMDLPGLGMDEQSGVIFYRYVIPTVNGEVDDTTLKNLVKAMQTVCTTFFPVILAVAYGVATFEEVLTKAKETQTKET